MWQRHVAVHRAKLRDNALQMHAATSSDKTTRLRTVTPADAAMQMHEKGLETDRIAREFDRVKRENMRLEITNKDFQEKIMANETVLANYRVLQEENRKLYNRVQDLQGNIRVFCRCGFLCAACATLCRACGDGGAGGAGRTTVAASALRCRASVFCADLHGGLTQIVSGGTHGGTGCAPQSAHSQLRQLPCGSLVQSSCTSAARWPTNRASTAQRLRHLGKGCSRHTCMGCQQSIDLALHSVRCS